MFSRKANYALIAVLLLCTIVGAHGRGQRGAAVRQRTNRKVVLAWADTRNGIGQHDSVSHALAVMERLGYESGVYDRYIRTDSAIISKTPQMTNGQPASGGPSLANVDAIGATANPSNDARFIKTVAPQHDRIPG